MQRSNADGRTDGEETDETDGRECHRGKSVRCACGALAFDWITTESGRFVLRCCSCREVVLEAENVEIAPEQLARLERLEARRARV